jgi:hypothetical protein
MYIYIYVYIYTVDSYSTIKNNEIISFAGKWRELVIKMLRKVSQVEKDKGGRFHSYVEDKSQG